MFFGSRGPQTGAEYSPRRNLFHPHSGSALPGHEYQHSGRDSVAGDAAIGRIEQWVVHRIDAHAKNVRPLGRQNSGGSGDLDGVCLSVLADPGLFAGTICCRRRRKLFPALRADPSATAVSSCLAALAGGGGNAVLHAAPGGRDCRTGGNPNQHAIRVADCRIDLAAVETSGFSPAVSHVAVSGSGAAGRCRLHLRTLHAQRVDDTGPLFACNRGAWVFDIPAASVASQGVAILPSYCSRNCRGLSPNEFRWLRLPIRKPVSPWIALPRSS